MDSIYSHLPSYNGYRFTVKNDSDELDQIVKAEKTLREFENHFVASSCSDYVPFCINKRSLEAIVRNRNRRSAGNEASQSSLRNFNNTDNFINDEAGDEAPIEQEDEDEEEDDDAAISEMSDREIYTRRDEDLQEDDNDMGLRWTN